MDKVESDEAGYAVYKLSYKYLAIAVAVVCYLSMLNYEGVVDLMMAM